MDTNIEFKTEPDVDDKVLEVKINADDLNEKINIKTEIESDESSHGGFERVFLKDPGYKPESSSKYESGRKRFKCSGCSKSLTATGIKRHELMHAGVNPFYCEVCGKTYANVSSFRVHQKMHKDELPHLCKICGKKFALNHRLKDHMKIHSRERPYQCSVCPYISKRTGDVKKHMRVHTKDNPVSLQRAFEKYCERKNSETESTVTEISNIDIVENKIDHLAVKTEITKIQDDQSVNNNTGLELQAETSIKSEIPPENSTPKPAKKRFKCLICFKILRSATGLRSHELIHEGKDPFYCEICEKTYASRNTFKVHQNIHKNERAFECKVCGKRFNLKQVLNYHLRTHDTDGELNCTFCACKCGSSGALKKHMRSHEEEREKLVKKVEDISENESTNSSFEMKLEPDVHDELNIKTESF